MRLEGHFNIHFKRAALLCAAAVLAVGFLPGCRSTRSGDRGKVLEAENINLRQVNDASQEQIRMAHATQARKLHRLPVDSLWVSSHCRA